MSAISGKTEEEIRLYVRNMFMIAQKYSPHVDQKAIDWALDRTVNEVRFERLCKEKFEKGERWKTL